VESGGQPRVIAALTIVDDGVYRTRRFRSPAYVGDPINAVKLFSDKGADEIVILDISGRPFEAGRMPLLRSIASEAMMPISYGGGVRDIEGVRSVIRNGYEKVVLNTALFDSPALSQEAAREFGAQAVVGSIEMTRTWFGGLTVLRDRGRRRVREPLRDWARRCEERGCGELLLTCVGRDGTMSGYDTEAVRLVAEAVTVPVIAMGGAGTVDHLRAGIDAGASAVAAGSMFVYFGPRRAVLINYPSEPLQPVR
jgi:cyclase